jgi:hypothetical protein
MNLLIKNFFIFVTCCLLVNSSRASTVITNNFSLPPANTSLEGGDLVISNCTLTMDGAHSFNSLTLGTGGTLTCTANPGGTATLSGTSTNEPLVLSGTNPATLFYSYVSGSVALTDSNQEIFTNGADFIQTTLGNQTQIARTANSTIPDGATVLATYNWSVSVNTGLSINLTSNLNVAAGGTINVNGAGYDTSHGFGHGVSSVSSPNYGSGGGHGGTGGMSSSNAPGGICYDIYNQPALPGVGGGASYAGTGGLGGGRIKITAGGSVNIDGAISANGMNGTNSRSGGGSGGSIWIIAANNFSCAGNIAANGGAGEPTHGGGGGGGMISIQYGTNIFSGHLAAYGAVGGKSGGGAGSIFTQTTGQTGLLTLDNGGLTGTNSIVESSPTTDLIVQNGAWAAPSGGTLNLRNLVIGTNGILAMRTAALLTLTLSGNCTIQAGGALLADTNGYAANTGLSGSGGGAYSGSSGSTYYCGGGGHGGFGGASGPATVGTPNDSMTGPTGAGGGPLVLSVNGTLQVDGKISANGGNGSGTGGGGGAGGSIYIQNCSLLAGSGSISANGGNGVPCLAAAAAADASRRISTRTFSPGLFPPAAAPARTPAVPEPFISRPTAPSTVKS